MTQIASCYEMCTCDSPYTLARGQAAFSSCPRISQKENWKSKRDQIWQGKKISKWTCQATVVLNDHDPIKKSHDLLSLFKKISVVFFWFCSCVSATKSLFRYVHRSQIKVNGLRRQRGGRRRRKKKKAQQPYVLSSWALEQVVRSAVRLPCQHGKKSFLQAGLRGDSCLKRKWLMLRNDIS